MGNTTEGYAVSTITLGEAIAKDAAAVNLPSGRISRETLEEVAQENVGLAFNRIASIAQNGNDKTALAAAKEVIELAHPTKQGTHVNVQVNNYSVTQILREINGTSTGLPSARDIDAVASMETE